MGAGLDGSAPPNSSILCLLEAGHSLPTFGCLSVCEQHFTVWLYLYLDAIYHNY